MKKYGEAVFGTVTEEYPCVHTSHGSVKGRNKRGAAVFRGIPYGEACIGDKRFRKAAPASNWKGVRDCTHLGHKSWQAEGNSDLTAKLKLDLILEAYEKEPEQMGEDCLNLNVVTPGLDNEKRPVAVYFHGGGFSAGSGSLAALSDKWAREEDIVVVGVNHRLNVFGYLYLGMLDEDYADSGNAGIYDLILSLEWIRDNIIAFGGDPDNVTIMGESGGCMKVNTLMSMPEARGLFRRAICESGSMPVNENTPEMAAECTLALLRELGLKKEEWRKLLEISPQDLTAAMQKAQLPGLGFRPVADGRAFSPSKSTSGSYALPEFAKEIPLMIGCSEDENATMLLPEIGSLTKENMAEKILESSKGWLTAGPVNEDNVHTLIAQTDKVKAGESLYQKLARNVSLGGKLCRDSYREAVAKAKEGGPVYHYLVTYDSPIPWMKDVRVAYHTADLPLQFRVVYFNECEFLSKIIAHNFAAFIRTGDPSTENLTWPMFTLEGRETMVFDKECRVESDPLREVWDILGQK